MFIRNMYESESKMEASHDGKGLLKHTIVLHTADFDTNLKFLIYTEMKPGTSIGNHEHGDDEEVYIVLEGTGEMTTNGEKVSVKKGDVILNKPYWSHGLENNSDKDLKILVFKVVK